jgi:hypothetical protein
MLVLNQPFFLAGEGRGEGTRKVDFKLSQIIFTQRREEAKQKPKAQGLEPRA